MIRSLLFLILFTLLANTAIAEQTNINEVTDLFDKNIDNKDAYFEEMQELNNQTAENVKSGEAVNSVEGINDSEAEINKVNAIDEFELDNAGRHKRSSDDLKFYDEYQLEPDFTKAGNRMHKEDADDITKATGSFNDFIERLKEFDIEFDCKAVKGPIEKEPVYYIDLKKEEISNTVYDQFFCEEARGEYSCRDELTLHCSDPSYIAGTLSNVQGNMTHTLTLDGVLTIGVNQTAYFYNDWGAQQDYYFTFDVDSASGIETFKLLDISWSDHVLVELNNQMIFGSSGVIGSLEMSTDPAHYRICSGDGERYFGTDRGDGIYVSANTKQYFDSSPHFEAKQFLQDGKNTLHIRLVYGRGGKIWTRLHYREKICPSWQETWEERCIIK